MAGIIRAMPGSEATRSRRVLKGLVALTVIVMAFFSGMLVERLRLDAKREEMLRRYNQILQQYRDQQMRSEKSIQR
jgi:Na+/H+ antiporter NhaB